MEAKKPNGMSKEAQCRKVSRYYALSTCWSVRTPNIFPRPSVKKVI